MIHTLETHGLWADLYRPDLSPSNSDFSVIGIPYDGGASVRKGTREAPARMRFWSHHLTPYTEDRTRLGKMRVCDLGDIEVKDPERDFQVVRQRVAQLPNIPILLGGDHSVTIPIFEGSASGRGQRLGVYGSARIRICAMSSPARGSLRVRAEATRAGLQRGRLHGGVRSGRSRNR
jgi:arginase family enzyme